MHNETNVTTFLFTDIEGSTRLWEQQPARMREALAHHDTMVRAAVQAHGGEVVKMTGDGLHAAFADPLDAILATLRMQTELLEARERFGVELRMRCGLHAGESERRDNDFYGTVVNRAARVMSAAHGGQVLLSQAVAERVRGRLPEELDLRDLGAVRLRDLQHPERLHQLLHPALRSEFPPLRSLETTPNNLPHLLSTFVGRDREREQVAKLLQSSRLVTILGVGGLGKSRLALHAAADVLQHFPDGVWRVELAAIREAHRVAGAAAAAMRVVEEPGRPIEEALERHVRDRKLLLLLDNCEHLLNASVSLTARLLAASPGIRILATSREPLRLYGEACLPLAPLAVPGPRAAAEALDLERFEAVRLFVERASSVQPEFRLTPQNAPTVAAICHRLDGIPLAIELAAARVRSLSLQQIAIRLGDRFRLLTGGDPTASPHQRTLIGSIEWSHELLEDAERTLFRRLAVFSGGWTLEAAEEICADDAVPRDDMLDLLTGLVEKSLVQATAGGTRYRFLESVREYARRQLEDSGESAWLRRSHFDHYKRAAEEAHSRVYGPERGPWLSRLDADLENLLSAHRWARGDASRGLADLELVGTLKHYWFARGLLELGLRVTQEALRQPFGSERTTHRGRTLFHAAQLLSAMGNHAEARRDLEECLAIARESGDRKLLGAVLQPLGRAAFAQQDRAMARACLEEAVTMAEGRGEPRELAAALSTLGQLLCVEGEPRRAAPLYERALGLAKEVGEREVEAIVQVNRAMGCIDEGDLDTARRLLFEAASIAHALEAPMLDQAVLEACSALACLRQEWERAGRFLGAAENRARAIGARRSIFDEAFLAPKIAAAHAGPGAQAFAEARSAGLVLPPGAAGEEARAWLQATAPAELVTAR